MKEQIAEMLAALSEQVTQMERLAEHEGALQQCLIDRDWDALEQLVPRMVKTSEAIEAAEALRDAAVGRLAQALGMGRAARFSEIIESLPEDSRRTLAELYRNLKIVVLRLQSRTAAIDTYVRATVSTMRGVLRELYPEHATHVYSRSGGGAFTGGQALVVNHHL